MKNSVRLFFKTKRNQPKQIDRTYVRYRELSRSIITQRLQYWSNQTNLRYNRVAIRNQKRRWGSCSSLKNLNFNYKLIFLPYELADYIIVHELCHLDELHHGESFWRKVVEIMPDYKVRMGQLRNIEKQFGTSVTGLTKARAHYPADATTLEMLWSGTASK